MFSVADRDCSSGLGPFIRTRARGGYLELSTDAVLYKLAVDNEFDSKHNQQH